MGRTAVLGVFLTVALAACSGAGASDNRLSGEPSHYLLTIDQLVTPDFSVYEGAHAVDAAAIAGTDQSQLHRLQSDGLQSAATIRFFRQVELATADGPIDIISTAERFATTAGASDVYQADVARHDAGSGETPISTGALGDTAHADSVVKTTASGIEAVQITLEWRTANVVNVIVVRGRYGGTRLDDALLIGHRQATNELP